MNLSTLALAAVFSVPAAALGDGRPDAADGPDKLFPVDVTRDILYCRIPGDPDRTRHQLDVFRPRGKEGCPVLFFVHGGAWVTGWKDDVLGIYGYGTIAESLARRGIVVVMPNYRLSPAVRHPEHIKDVARAFAWTCDNVREYGGDPGHIYVGGHSAGGHLVSLLATDESYLKAEGHSASVIRGVVGISGVYCLDDLAFEMSFGGGSGFTFALRASPLYPIFGADPAALRRASPVAHVRPGLPPFLLINGALDYCPLHGMTRQFAAALKEQGCSVRTKEIAWRTHETVLFDILHLDEDATTRAAILDFIAELEKGSR
jgi:acetyl esterase/lipase